MSKQGFSVPYRASPYPRPTPCPIKPHVPRGTHRGLAPDLNRVGDFQGCREISSGSPSTIVSAAEYILKS